MKCYINFCKKYYIFVSKKKKLHHLVLGAKDSIIARSVYNNKEDLFNTYYTSIKSKSFLSIFIGL